MTEEHARNWVRTRFGVSRETRLADFVEIVRAEAATQNLVSQSSLSDIWSRHVVDSAQLVSMTNSDGTWVDIGSGAGFPGMVVAILRGAPTILIEPRRRRADFLSDAAIRLGLTNAIVKGANVQATSGSAAVISARAVAPIAKLFTWGSGWASSDTLWLLPRGRTGQDELADVRKKWQGSFHVEQSLTSPDSIVVQARGVRPR